MKITHLLTLCLISSCSYATETVLDIATIENNTFQIIKENNQCYLTNKNFKKKLSPKPPCYFLRNKDKLELHTYDDVNVQAVIIVVGTTIDNATRKEWGLDDKIICGSVAQGILIQQGIPHVSKKTLEGGVICKDKGTDEKNFWYFAH